MRVLFLGAGGVGSVMATAMSESDVFSLVVVADIDADHAVVCSRAPRRAPLLCVCD